MASLHSHSDSEQDQEFPCQNLVYNFYRSSVWRFSQLDLNLAEWNQAENITHILCGFEPARWIKYGMVVHAKMQINDRAESAKWTKVRTIIDTLDDHEPLHWMAAAQLRPMLKHIYAICEAPGSQLFLTLKSIARYVL